MYLLALNVLIKPDNSKIYSSYNYKYLVITLNSFEITLF